MKFYTINEDYIAYLRGFDTRVPHNYEGSRPYIGIVLSINKHDYLAPLTSYKPKQDQLKSSNQAIFKIHEKSKPDNKLGMISLNNMIPILKSEINEVDFLTQEIRYRNLLTKQLAFIKSNQTAIQQQATNLYDLVTVKKYEFYCNLSCNFEALEKCYLSFKK